MARSLETLQVELRAHQDRSPDAAKLAAADAGLPAKAVPQLRSVIKGHERKAGAMVPSIYLHVASAKAPRADSSGCWLCYTPSASGRAARPLGSHWMGGPPTPLPPHYHPTSTTAGLPPLLPMAEPAPPTSAAFTPQVYCVQWSGDSSRIASAGQESLSGLGPLRG
eukprot:scaffold35182_cov56-Phaeocystis_antarctica.AAC.1